MDGVKFRVGRIAWVRFRDNLPEMSPTTTLLLEFT